MALSNWDTLSVGLDDKSSGSTFETPEGVTAEIYKNWIYIRNKNGQQPVMTIQEGELTYRDLHIMAKRGPQEGVYCLLWCSEWKEGKNHITGITGCGVYGYSEDGEFVGVTEDSKLFLKTMIASTEHLKQEEKTEIIARLVGGKRFNQGDKFILSKLGVENPQEEAQTEVGKQNETILSKIFKTK